MRGGGTRGGGGQNHDKGKRQATTPIGGRYKDSRRNITGEEHYDDDEEEEWTQVIHNKPKSPRAVQREPIQERDQTAVGSDTGVPQLNQPRTSTYAAAAAPRERESVACD